MRARYSERTAKILLALARRSMTAEELSKAIRCRVGTVRSTLTRLVQYRQVSRERIQDGTVIVDKDEKIERPRHLYRYTITGKGHDRLERLTDR